MAEHGKITVRRSGLYLATGSVPTAVVKIETNAKGESIKWGEGDENIIVSLEKKHRL